MEDQFMFGPDVLVAPLPGRQEQSFLLHPFADQGAIRGICGVFMEYIKPDV